MFPLGGVKEEEHGSCWRFEVLCCSAPPACDGICVYPGGGYNEDGLYIYFIDVGVPAPLAAVRKSKMVKLMNCRVHNRKLNMKCSVLKMNCGVLGCLNYCLLQNCWKFKVNCCVLGCFCSRIQNWGFALLDIYTSGSLLLLASGMDRNQIYWEPSVDLFQLCLLCCSLCSTCAL